MVTNLNAPTAADALKAAELVKAATFDAWVEAAAAAGTALGQIANVEAAIDAEPSAELEAVKATAAAAEAAYAALDKTAEADWEAAYAAAVPTFEAARAARAAHAARTAAHPILVGLKARHAAVIKAADDASEADTAAFVRLENARWDAALPMG